MEWLPTELLDMIFEYADFTTVKNVRLTSKTLVQAASAHLFRDVYMILSPEHLRNLQKIAEQAELRDLVKTFTFQGELLPQLTDQDAWEELIDLRPSVAELVDERIRMERAIKGQQLTPKEREALHQAVVDERKALPRHTKTADELSWHFQLYQEFFEGQMSWDDEREGEAFRQAIEQFPNLTEAKVIESYHSGNRTPGWVTLISRILLGPDNWWRLRASTEENASMKSQLSSVQHLSCLLEAVILKNEAHPTLPFTHLAIITGGDAFWCQRHRLLADSSPRNELNPHVASMKDAFTYLTHLRFKVWFLEHQFTDALTAGLALFLREATKLEDLALEFVEEKLVGVEENDQLCDMLTMVEDVTWPRLRALSLTLTSTEDAFMRLLKRHASTLRVLRLIDSNLRVAAGSWLSILRKIPEFLTLDRIYLEALVDGTIEIGKPCLFELKENDAYERAFEEYLLHGGLFPIIDREEFYRDFHERNQWVDTPDSPSTVDEVLTAQNAGSHVQSDPHLADQPGVLTHFAAESDPTHVP